jgi:two-component system chemotaxis response regulator CheY
MKLLVVDDSLVVRNAIERAVAGGVVTTVVRAADGAEAVALFEHHRPELVTMDLTMPNLDGIAAITAIVAIDPQAAILVISALNSHATALEAIRRGACGFLTKPFVEAEVAAAIEELATHAAVLRAEADHG